MNYEDMTDFDINKAVATAWLECDYDFDDSGKTVDLVGYQTYLGAHGVPDERLEKYGEFNPLKNISDAWPIMMENKITVIDFFNEYIAVHDIQFNDNEHSDSVADWVLEARHKNPLRAAMIVYLMMNESRN